MVDLSIAMLNYQRVTLPIKKKQRSLSTAGPVVPVVLFLTKGIHPLQRILAPTRSLGSTEDFSLFSAGDLLQFAIEHGHLK